MDKTVQHRYLPFKEKDKYPDAITESFDFVQKEVRFWLKFVFLTAHEQEYRAETKY